MSWPWRHHWHADHLAEQLHKGPRFALLGAAEIEHILLPVQPVRPGAIIGKGAVAVEVEQVDFFPAPQTQPDGEEIDAIVGPETGTGHVSITVSDGLDRPERDAAATLEEPGKPPTNDDGFLFGIDDHLPVGQPEGCDQEWPSAGHDEPSSALAYSRARRQQPERDSHGRTLNFLLSVVFTFSFLPHGRHLVYRQVLPDRFAAVLARPANLHVIDPGRLSQAESKRQLALAEVTA